MRVIIQRVTAAEVQVNGQVVGSISQGYVLLVGFTHHDNDSIIEAMATKVLHLRILEDLHGKMNESILQKQQQILSVPQFTLYGDPSTGRRPSFIQAANPTQANEWFRSFNEKLAQNNIVVQTGIFGAHMQVRLTNDGPVTIILDSDTLFKKSE